jgi:serine protease Do
VARARAIVFIAALSAACAPARPATPAAPPAASADAQPGNPGSAAAARAALSPAEIAARSTPAIVSIRTELGLGTGFLVRPQGWVVTNFHVIAGAEQIEVTLPNQRSLPVVEVVRASAHHDLVLLRIEASGLPVLALAKPDAVHAGDPVVVIGHPLGLEDTVSNGLVSALREVGDLTALQISAPIAPGSSGGPLFNEHGEVIGVATAILRGGQNLNWGMPVKYVHELLADPKPVSLADFVAAEKAVASAEAPASNQPPRNVPHHELSLFEGCDDDAVSLIGQGIQDAISVGAPLYNQGNLTACYHIYEGAALDLERRLPKPCRGPKAALAKGRGVAAKLPDPGMQAWALRDAFDGITDALLRKLAKKP